MMYIKSGHIDQFTLLPKADPPARGRPNNKSRVINEKNKILLTSTRNTNAVAQQGGYASGDLGGTAVLSPGGFTTHHGIARKWDPVALLGA